MFTLYATECIHMEERVGCNASDMHTHTRAHSMALVPLLSCAVCSADLLMMDTPPPEQPKLNKTPRTGPRVTFVSPKAKDLLTYSPYMMAVSHCPADRIILALTVHTYVRMSVLFVM